MGFKWIVEALKLLATITLVFNVPVMLSTNNYEIDGYPQQVYTVEVDMKGASLNHGFSFDMFLWF